MFNFTHEPRKELCVNKGDVSYLFWRVESAESCLEMQSVQIDRHSLGRNGADDLPISNTSEYNLTLITVPKMTEDCGESGFELNMSLSLRFTDNVLQYVHYILIKVRTSEMLIWSNVSIISGRSDSCSDLQVLETTTDDGGSVTAKVTYDNVRDIDVANTSTGIACCVKSNLLLILTLLLLHQTASSIFAGYVCGFI